MTTATIIPLRSGGALLDAGDDPQWHPDRHAAADEAEARGFRWVLADPPVEPAPAT